MSHVHSVFQEADLRYTYCPDYHHSMTVVPVSEEALNKRYKEEALQCWKTPAGWIFPGKKTMRESNVHSKKPHPARVDDIHKVGFIHCKLDMQNSARFLAPNLKGRELSRTVALLAPNPKGLGSYNLDTVGTYVRTSVDSDFSEGYGLNSLKLYTKIKYGLRIMHVKYIFDIIQNCGLAAILDVNTLGAVTRTPPTGFLSNLVKRKRLGGPTCIPFIFCLVSKMVTWRPYLFFDPHDNTVLAYYISKIVQDRVFVTL